MRYLSFLLLLLINNALFAQNGPNLDIDTPAVNDGAIPWTWIIILVVIIILFSFLRRGRLGGRRRGWGSRRSDPLDSDLL